MFKYEIFLNINVITLYCGYRSSIFYLLNNFGILNVNMNIINYK